MMVPSFPGQVSYCQSMLLPVNVIAGQCYCQSMLLPVNIIAGQCYCQSMLLLVNVIAGQLVHMPAIN